MKILLTTDLYTPTINGVVTSVVTLKKELERRGNEVRVLTLGEESDKDKRKDVYYFSSVGFGKIYPGARVTLKTDKNLLQDIIDWSPDIIHSQTEFSTFRISQKVAEKLSIPIVHTYHTVYEDYTHYFPPSKIMGKKIVSSLSRIILKDVSTIIAPTQKVATMLDSYGMQASIEVISTGIDLEKFQFVYPEEEIQVLKATYQIPEHHNILISLGRLGKEKNIQELIEYINQLKRKNCTLLIVGDGPYRSELERMTTECRLDHQVKFTGLVHPDDVAKYYQMADIFVSASTSETQGLTYIEALATSTPAVCRMDPCLDGVLLDDINGYTYQNFEEFSRSINKILDDPLLNQKLSRNAGDLAFQNHSSEKFAEHVENLYRTVMTESSMKNIYV